MKGSDPSVSVTVDNAKAITFALEQAGVPIVHGARIHNLGDEPLPASTLTIELLPDLGPPSHIEIEPLGPGQSIELGAIDIRLPPNRLRTITEAERGRLVWRLTTGGRALAEDAKSVDILAYNEWSRLGPPEILAMYVTPNHPVVTSILRMVREKLRQSIGETAIDGYQSRSTERVLRMVAALYESLQSFGISYQECLASFEECGQKVRFADQVLSDQLANCLDMTLLAASCLEQMGLNPLLVLVKGHAFPGVWLREDRFPEGVVQDAARLRTIEALGELVFFDSSTTILHPKRSLDEARSVAQGFLADETFEFAIDVQVARAGGYRPLPLRDVAKFADPQPQPAGAEPTTRAISTEARALLDEAVRIPLTEDSPPSSASSPEPLDPLHARLQRWRERLLDLSLRNRLLNFRDTKAALALDVPNVALFEDALAEEGAFELRPSPSRTNDPRHPDLLAARTDEKALKERIEKDFERRVVHSPLAEAEFTKRVIHLERSARSDIEEGGANTLFAAIGTLHWYESESSEALRRAPLLLVPIALERDRLSGRVRLRGLPDDAVPNVTLVEKLRQDFDIDLSALANLEADESGRDVDAMFRHVRQAIRHMPRWEAIEEANLGLFTFAKFLMWRDLEENVELLLESPVVRHIATSANSPFPNPAEAAEPGLLDETVPPAELPLVVDADSTQMAAIVSALRGRSFVLQGPPGTGKSQTITNLIAASLAKGRTVLFISEKMAALDVVKRRLEQVGLGDFCLELHSHKAQRKEVVESFGRSLMRAQAAEDPLWEERSVELSRDRARLNAYARALHQGRPLRKSFHEASARLLALESTPKIAASFDTAFADMTAATELQFRDLLEAASAYAASASGIGDISGHPFENARLGEWSSAGEASLGRSLDEALRLISALAFAGQQLASMTGTAPSQSPFVLEALAQLAKVASNGPIPPWLIDEAAAPVWAQRARTYLMESQGQARSREELGSRWSEELYQLDLESLEARFTRFAHSFFLIAFFFLWGARSRLRRLRRGPLPDNAHILSDIQFARAALAQSRWLEEERRALGEGFAGCWQADNPETLAPLLERADHFRAALRRYREASPYSQSLDHLVSLAHPQASLAHGEELPRQAGAVLQILTTLREHTEKVLAIVDPFPGTIPLPNDPEYLPSLQAILARWKARLSEYRSFCFYRENEASLAAWGALPIIEAHRAGAISHDEIVRATERSFLETWTARIRDSEPALRTFDGPNQHRLVERFQRADSEYIGLARGHVAALLGARLPRVDGSLSDASETGKLQRELRKKARHLPVRRLLAELPNLATRLKPCFLMSPMSVAQYLPADARKFDLVVFDEASQIGTHDAIGAIARGNQVVIVGDSKQLPPTSFFQRGVQDDGPVDENDIEELESILDEAIASGIPEEMLGWHYRSRHEALIDFSNQHYYDGRLFVFPAARGQTPELGVSFHHIANGVYDKSKTRTNRAEAEALVTYLVDALRRFAPGERSFGVLSFSQAQQILLQDLLDEARAKHPEIEGHFASDLFEPVFVKNLENVQGDERDEMLFSVGYGPDENGRVFMHFGPLNRQGGERRLNVAITRAKQKLRVFSTLTHEQIDLARTSSMGARHLKAFLRYAAEQSREDSAQRLATSGDFDSDFERQVHDALVAKGYRVDSQVGCGAYRIDLAVHHPEESGIYLLGIECDGAAYHSAATARDRDRLRQQVLEGLGWRLHRIWSTDWWFHREREIERLEEAIEEALRAPIVKHDALQVPPLPEPRERAQDAFPPTPVPAEVEPSPVVPYKKASLRAIDSGSQALYDAALTAKLREQIEEVLRVEAPIHLDELSRRVGSSFGQGRLTDRLRARVLETARMMTQLAHLRDDFVWRQDQKPESFSVIRSNGEGERSVELIPREELAAAAAWVLSRSLSTTEDDLIRETARLFGFSRVGSRIAERVRAGIELLEEQGRCAKAGERVEWRE